MLNIQKEAKVPKAEFTPVTARRKSAQTQLAEDQVIVGATEDTGEQDDDDVGYRSEVFSCPEDGCIKREQGITTSDNPIEVTATPTTSVDSRSMLSMGGTEIFHCSKNPTERETGKAPHGGFSNRRAHRCSVTYASLLNLKCHQLPSNRKGGT